MSGRPRTERSNVPVPAGWNAVRGVMAACLGIALASCAGGFADKSGFGAHQGGVQDASFAHELVASGRVPPPEALPPEAFFSSHDLGLWGDACNRLLCLRAALGIAPGLTGEPAGWVQVGLASTVDPETYEAPSTTLVAAVDVSGSMGWNYNSRNEEYPTPGSVAAALLRQIATGLRSADRIAIVTYGSSVVVELPLTGGALQADIQAAIERLRENGSTDMESGLREAFTQARAALDGQTDNVRVLLFTDVQPNVGATSASAFEELASNAAADGIGLTVFGLGVGLDQSIMNAMSDLRGGNAFTLQDYEDVDAFVDESWPFFMVPIAHSLAVELNPGPDLTPVATYGFAGSEGALGLNVSSVFLSRKKGALLVELAPASNLSLTGLQVTANIRYEDTNGEVTTETLGASLDQPSFIAGRTFAQPSVGETVALAMLAAGATEACTLYRGHDQYGAVIRMRAVVDRLAADLGALGTSDLDTELDFAMSLLRLIEQGAPQGTMYDQGSN